MRPLLLSLAITMVASLNAQQRLQVAPGGTHLQTTAGDPFFYLGDTAWELIHRLDRAETRQYLTHRAGQGFNVIQTVVLAELEGLTDPNPYGHLPLIGQDPARPNEAYFEHVDHAVRLADSLNVFLGLLPTWGDKFNKQWGVGPEVFTPANAETFGEYLGRRYVDNNIIWILGGDRNPADAEDMAIVRAMAKGLRAAVGDRQLISYHPQGGFGSYDFFAEDEWLDFHLFQTGHGVFNDKHNYDFPRKARGADPKRPVINGEPAYEDHPVNWRPVNGWFDDFDTRQAAWWSVLAGGVGHAFGNHNIWQMWAPGREPISSARTPWYEALYYPAAGQMRHLRGLMETVPYWKLSVDFNVFEQAPNSSGREVIAARSADHIVAYIPYGDRISIQAEKLPTAARYTWYNPRSGERILFTPKVVGELYEFDPPLEARRGNDWVLWISGEG